MVCFDDDELADRALLLRRWGRRSEVQLFGSRKGVDVGTITGTDGKPVDRQLCGTTLPARSLNGLVALATQLGLPRGLAEASTARELARQFLEADTWHPGRAARCASMMTRRSEGVPEVPIVMAGGVWSFDALIVASSGNDYAAANGVAYGPEQFDVAFYDMDNDGRREMLVTAHHAIIPTAAAPHVVLSTDELSLYELVARRYLQQLQGLVQIKHLGVDQRRSGQTMFQRLAVWRADGLRRAAAPVGWPAWFHGWKAWSCFYVGCENRSILGTTR